jgi:hypothetical protein
MPITRRTFIKAGVLGTAALAAAGAWGGWRLRACSAHPAPLSPAGRALFAAMIPALLDGAVAPGAWTAAMGDEALRRVEVTIAALSPHAQRELHQLACLLDARVARLLLAGSGAPWPVVTRARAGAILARWRFSRSALLVSAYQALHDLTFAAWYAEPAHWAAIGYPGPPELERGA